MSSVSKSAGAVPVHKSKAKAAQTRRGLLYALPDWLMIIVLFFVPIVLLVVMACSRWSLLGGNRGVNFPDNFVKVFENKLFWPSIWFTLEYTVIVTIFLLVLGLGMAMIVQESSKWNNVLRTCFLLPSATGLASASLLFYALYSPQVGPVTKILSSLGLMQEGGSVLATGQSALWATIIVIVWRFSGYYMLLMMIGLQAIPGDLYEAARMDGAGSWRIFRSITLPLMKPTIVMCLVYCVTGSILAFDQFFILTKGGPNNSTMTVVQLIYNFAFDSKKDLGMAAALSLLSMPQTAAAASAMAKPELSRSISRAPRAAVSASPATQSASAISHALPSGSGRRAAIYGSFCQPVFSRNSPAPPRAGNCRKSEENSASPEQASARYCALWFPRGARYTMSTPERTDVQSPSRANAGCAA